MTAWWAPGWDLVGREIAEGLRSAPWGEAPPPLECVGPVRRMRVVTHGRWPGAPAPIYVKHSRPVTRVDRLRRTFLGGKGRREGRLLRTLLAEGLPVPKVVGYEDDLLVTEAFEGLRPLPDDAAMTREETRRLGELLGRLWKAGLRHADLHRGNLGFVGEDPVLVDLGGARLGRPAPKVRTLGALRHAVFGGTSTAQAWRALRAFLAGAGLEGGRATLRDLAPRIEREARKQARRYRRGRDRRALRNGRHFERGRTPTGLDLAKRRETPQDWREQADVWMAGEFKAPLALKADRRVLRFLPDPAGPPRVWKRYDGVAPGRRPRPHRAFLRQVQLEHRGVRAPRALLAVADAHGAGGLVSEWVDAENLHELVASGRLRTLEPKARRALLEALGRFLRKMHDAGISHRDLKAPNLLVEEPTTFLVADLDGVRIPRRGVSWARRAKDLARLDASLDATRADRGRVLNAYWRVHPRPPTSPRTFLKHVARHVAKKRGPSGMPR